MIKPLKANVSLICRLNLIRLLPRLTELLVYDNSSEANPDAGERPEPKFLLHMASGKIVSTCDLQLVPEWAKPIVAGGFKIVGRRAPPPGRTGSASPVVRGARQSLL